MENCNDDEQTQNITDGIDLDEILREVNNSDEFKNRQNIQNIERIMGDGNAMQDHSPERIQASTSKTIRKARKRRYERARVIKPRASKDKAKHMITYLSKSQIKKSVRSFKRKAVRSEVTLKRRLHRRRSSDSVASDLCPICKHSCCNWLSK